MKREILEAIWDRSRPAQDAHPYIAYIDRRTGRFAERTVPEWEMLGSAYIQYEMMDHFFSPLLFEGPRTNATASLPGVLFADLDGVPAGSLGGYQASVVWKTSPGNYQAVWFLAEAPPDAVRWADVNQRLTYATQADKGGWHASKLLRVPHTRNFKYPEAPLGKVLSFNPNKKVDFLELEDTLPKVVTRQTEAEKGPVVMSQEDWRAYVRGYWDELSLEQRSLLAAKVQVDRSGALVRLANDLERSGFDPIARFHLLWGLAWNKWRTDRWNPSYLWHVVNS